MTDQRAGAIRQIRLEVCNLLADNQQGRAEALQHALALLMTGRDAYRQRIAVWMRAREANGGTLTDEQESEHAEACNDIWRTLTDDEQSAELERRTVVDAGEKPAF